MVGDSKGEYRGLYYRNDADLNAWLAQRPRETAWRRRPARSPVIAEFPPLQPTAVRWAWRAA